MDDASIKVLGLSKKEEKVLYALREGNDSPAGISQNTKVSRPSVYDILGKLKKRGLVYSYIEQRKKKW